MGGTVPELGLNYNFLGFAVVLFFSLSIDGPRDEDYQGVVCCLKSSLVQVFVVGLETVRSFL